MLFVPNLGPFLHNDLYGTNICVLPIAICIESIFPSMYIVGLISSRIMCIA